MDIMEIETNIKIIREHVEGYNDAAITVNIRPELGGHELIVVAEHGVPLVEIDTDEIDLPTALEWIDNVLRRIDADISSAPAAVIAGVLGANSSLRRQLAGPSGGWSPPPPEPRRSWWERFREWLRR